MMDYIRIAIRHIQSGYSIHSLMTISFALLFLGGCSETPAQRLENVQDDIMSFHEACEEQNCEGVKTFFEKYKPEIAEDQYGDCQRIAGHQEEANLKSLVLGGSFGSNAEVDKASYRFVNKVEANGNIHIHVWYAVRYATKQRFGTKIVENKPIVVNKKEVYEFIDHDGKILLSEITVER